MRHKLTTTVKETCSHCGKPVVGYGVCETLYRKRLRAGWKRQKPLLDPTPAVAHIAEFRAHHWSFDRIGKAAGLPHSAIASIYNGRYQKISEKNLNAILSVPLPRPLPVHVTALGVKRRVQALAWMGWSRKLVAQDMGVSEYCLDTAVDQHRFSLAVGLKLHETYLRLSGKTGPSCHSATMAKNRGWPPPAAWDDDEIDTAPDLKAGIVRTDRKLRGKYRTHCKRNHEQTEENVLWKPGNVRKCRLCHNLNLREYRRRQRELKTA